MHRSETSQPICGGTISPLRQAFNQIPDPGYGLQNNPEEKGVTTIETPYLGNINIAGFTEQSGREGCDAGFLKACGEDDIHLRSRKEKTWVMDGD